MDSSTRNGLALCALAFLLSGCGAKGFLLAPVAAPDSVRWVCPDKANPYALVWANGSANLWWHDTFPASCPFTVGQRVISWDVAYAGKAVADTITGTVTAWHSDSGDTVVAGGCRCVVGLDTAACLAWAAVARHDCGDRDTTTFTLVRAP